MNIKRKKNIGIFIGAMAILLVMALPCLCQEFSGNSIYHQATKAMEKNQDTDSLVVSIITAYPGPEIYELCGHAAVRVRGAGIDSVWNFGIFDFNQPDFVYRFVKGETDYRCAAYPFAWFLPEYVERGSKVVEQDLDLTPQEAERILESLRRNALPENATYRYNYVKDNCATRILDRMEEASEEEIIYPADVDYGTFRKEMRAYHEGYPWYQFGIDIALGSGLDYKLNSKEEMFVPVEMMKHISEAKFSDGRKLVKEERVLNNGSERSVLPATRWYAGPLFWSWFFAFLTGIIVAWNIRTWHVTRIYYALWFLLLGFAGLLVAFLVFISVHEATSPNILIFWLNPLQFIFVIGVVIKKLNVLARIMAWYNIITSGALLLTSPFFLQSFNPAFYPLLLSTLALGGAYAIITTKSSYKKR